MGLDIKFDPIIQDDPKLGHDTNEWGVEPLIKTDDLPKTSLSNDIKSMAADFKKDYDDLSRGLKYMKNDFAPKVKQLAQKIKKSKLIWFKNPKSYKADESYTKY